MEALKVRDQRTRSVLLVGDTTLDPLGRMLERPTPGLSLKSITAPYGQTYQVLLEDNQPIQSNRPEILVVWTAPDLTLPSFAKLLQFEVELGPSAHDAVMEE